MHRLSVVLAVAAFVPSFAAANPLARTHEAQLRIDDFGDVLDRIQLERAVHEARQAKERIEDTLVRRGPRLWVKPGQSDEFRRFTGRFYGELRQAVRHGGRRDGRVRDLADWGVRTEVIVHRHEESVLSWDEYRSLGFGGRRDRRGRGDRW